MTISKRIIIKDPIERFWHFVNIPENRNECWEWTGRKSYKGYGGMKINEKHVQSHRFSYELHYGEIPHGLLVCHKCDNPSCVNPSHLFLGTIAENNLDRDIKGRKALGERNGKSKLTKQDVIEIKKMISSGISSADISRKFNRPHGTIAAIKLGRSWTWVK